MADGRAMAPLTEATQATVLPLGGISQVGPQADVGSPSVGGLGVRACVDIYGSLGLC